MTELVLIKDNEYISARDELTRKFESGEIVSLDKDSCFNACTLDAIANIEDIITRFTAFNKFIEFVHSLYGSMDDNEFERNLVYLAFNTEHLDILADIDAIHKSSDTWILQTMMRLDHICKTHKLKNVSSTNCLLAIATLEGKHIKDIISAFDTKYPGSGLFLRNIIEEQFVHRIAYLQVNTEVFDYLVKNIDVSKLNITELSRFTHNVCMSMYNDIRYVDHDDYSLEKTLNKIEPYLKDSPYWSRFKEMTLCLADIQVIQWTSTASITKAYESSCVCDSEVSVDIGLEF